MVSGQKRLGIILLIVIAIPVAALGVLKVVSYLTDTEEKRINAMVPTAGAALRTLIESLNQAGIRTLVGNTVRSTEESQRYVLEGKASANLKNDWHTIGRAVDMYVLDPANGNAVDFNGVRVDLIKQMHDMAKAQGWRSIAFNDDGSKHYLKGAKGPVWDAGHLEWRDGYTFDEAKAAGLIDSLFFWAGVNV